MWRLRPRTTNRMPPMLPQPATILRMRMNPRLDGLPAYGKPYGTKMDNVLDPRDQIWFDYGRATGVTTLVQWVWVYNRPIDIDGLRQFEFLSGWRVSAQTLPGLGESRSYHPLATTDRLKFPALATVETRVSELPGIRCWW